VARSIGTVGATPRCNIYIYIQSICSNVVEDEQGDPGVREGEPRCIQACDVG
jgi:hypothetical protein